MTEPQPRLSAAPAVARAALRTLRRKADLVPFIIGERKMRGRSARPRRKPVQPEKARGATGTPSSGTTLSVHQQLPLEASLNGRS